MEQNYKQMRFDELKQEYRQNHRTINSYIGKNLCQVPMCKRELIKTIKFQEGILSLIELNKLLYKVA